MGEKNVKEFALSIQIPGLLSVLTVEIKIHMFPVLKIIYQEIQKKNIMSASEKMENGNIARSVLDHYQKARKNNDTAKDSEYRSLING